MLHSTVRFCPECAGTLNFREIAGETRNHLVCERCGALYYDSPKVVVKCFVFHGRRLLWAQRGIDPNYGLWAIPGGFLESGESLVEGAVREVREEAGVHLDPGWLQFYMTGSVTFVNQVHIAFRTVVGSDSCKPGIESLDCQFFSREEAPWDAMAYPEIEAAMVQAYDELECGSFRVWQAELGPGGYDRRPVSDTI